MVKDVVMGVVLLVWFFVVKWFFLAFLKFLGVIPHPCIQQWRGIQLKSFLEPLAVRAE